MKYAFLIAALSAGAALLSSCESTPVQRPASATPAKPAAAQYECPMGCEGSRSSKPGKCPTCGMDLEKKS